MARQTLAVKYRPSTFDDVVEQSAIKDILMDQIETGTFQHSYLFCGPAGCGKTTAARIFANDINGGQGSPIEVDAASNNGVDNVRDIIDGARRKPLDCDYKTYIIDECFHKDTLIDTPTGKRRICSIKPGDKVYNMTGVATVSNVFKNRVFTNRLCCVTINGEQILTTVDHLFFTNDGWVSAKDLVEGDTVYVHSNLSELRKGISEESKRRKIMQSGMCKSIEPSNSDKVGDSKLCDMWEGISMQATSRETDLFKGLQKYIDISNREGKEVLRPCSSENEGEQSFESTGCASQDSRDSKEEWDFTHLDGCSWREWSLYEASDSFERVIGYGVDTRVRDTHPLSAECSPLSYELQSRPRLTYFKTGDRGGWCRPQYEVATVIRRKENEVSEQFRVDRVEIYQPGNNDRLFECYFSNSELREETVEMYDLEVKGHPSYFAGGVLVHNCHMLSIGAWNAMLKLLEEPPATAIFIMCTTDPQKIPATILSRVQRYNFSKISLDSIINRLRYIVACENNEILESGGPDGAYEVEEEAIQYIAKLADGGMRDAITMLDKCLSLTDTITVKDAVRALGTVDYSTHFDLLFQLECGNKGQAVKLIEDVYNSGKDLKQFIKQFQYFVLDVCKFCTFHDFKYVNIPALPEYKQKMEDDDRDMALAVLEWVRELNSSLRWESNPKAIVQSSVFLFNPPELG